MKDVPFEAVYFGDAAIADVNGDHHPDVLLSGKTNSGDLITKLYKNDGKGHFTEVKNLPFEGIHTGFVAIGDMNGDDLPDVFLSGYGASSKITRLYINNGN